MMVLCFGAYLPIFVDSCRPRPPLIMPRVITIRPSQMCAYDQITRFEYFLKAKWWMNPKNGWKRSRMKTIMPMMG